MTVNFTFGIIEGFFGKTWSWSERITWATFLAEIGGDLYLYAPKKDPFLRRRWREPMENQHFEALKQCRAAYQAAQVGFGVGLTPFDVQLGLSSSDCEALHAKVVQLNQLNLDWLAILFDDMRGDFPGLAASQLEVIQRITAVSNAKRIVICPTYYSDDPVLEQVFGQRPLDYWQTLQALDPAIEIFWTGPKVCSHDYPLEHLTEVGTRFNRPVMLWDNYPVNDGKRLTTKLHLHGIGGRNAQIKAGCRGQLMNPMNQPLLSRIAIATMARVHRQGLEIPPKDCQVEIETLAASDLTQLLIRDAQSLADPGMEGFSKSDRALLRSQYAQCHDPMALEVVDWLDGVYEFDPACLTD